MRFLVVPVAVALIVSGCAHAREDEEGPVLAASGYLQSDHSIVDPYCGAVLVAPGLAITSARCIPIDPPGQLRLGFGEMGSGPTVAVRPGLFPGDELAGLVLLEPVDVAPAPLAQAATSDGAHLRAIAYDYVEAGHTGPRRIVESAVEAADDGAVCLVGSSVLANPGGGLFDEDGTVVGIAAGRPSSSNRCGDGGVEYAGLAVDASVQAAVEADLEDVF